MADVEATAGRRRRRHRRALTVGRGLAVEVAAAPASTTASNPTTTSSPPYRRPLSNPGSHRYLLIVGDTDHIQPIAAPVVFHPGH